MSSRSPTDLARRLLGSARRERPSAELAARIRATGRAELERAGAEPASGSERATLRDAPSHSERAPGARQSSRWAPARPASTRRWAAGGGIAAAAGAVLYLGLASSPDRGVLISAERSGAAPASRQPSPTAGSEPTASTTSDDAIGQRDDAAPHAESAHAIPPARSSSVAVPSAAPKAPATAAAPSTPGAASTPAIASSRRTSSEPAPRSTEASRPTLGQQLEQIKQARAALRAGDHRRALELLDAYRTRSAGAELAAEASLLRIEALAASGQQGEAARAARQFASDYPNSPLIDRALSFTASAAER